MDSREAPGSQAVAAVCGSSLAPHGDAEDHLPIPHSLRHTAAELRDPGTPTALEVRELAPAFRVSAER